MKENGLRHLPIPVHILSNSILTFIGQGLAVLSLNPSDCINK